MTMTVNPNDFIPVFDLLSPSTLARIVIDLEKQNIAFSGERRVIVLAKRIIGDKLGDRVDD